MMVRIFATNDDAEVLSATCYYMYYLSKDETTPNKGIQAVLAAGAARPLVRCLGYGNPPA
jgi:hypothetical protein